MRLVPLGSVVVLVTTTVACHTMKPLALEDLDSVRPAQAWVTRADQSVVVVAGPQIVRNRLAGFVDGVYQVMPTSEVKQVRVRRPATARTAALVAAGAVGAAGLVVLLSGTGDYDDPCSRASSECLDDPMAWQDR